MFDMGTDNQELWADKLYLGLKHKRLDGDEYVALTTLLLRFVFVLFREH